MSESVEDDVRKLKLEVERQGQEIEDLKLALGRLINQFHSTLEVNELWDGS